MLPCEKVTSISKGRKVSAFLKTTSTKKNTLKPTTKGKFRKQKNCQRRLFLPGIHVDKAYGFFRFVGLFSFFLNIFFFFPTIFISPSQRHFFFNLKKKCIVSWPCLSRFLGFRLGRFLGVYSGRYRWRRVQS